MCVLTWADGEVVGKDEQRTDFGNEFSNKP